MPEPRDLVAYVDEAMRATTTEEGRSIYVMAAVAVVVSDQLQARDTLAAALQGRSSRFHWRLEQPARRRAMLDTIATLELPCLATTCSYAGGRKQPRARTLVLQRLLWELTQLGVRELVLETREEGNDAKDRVSIAQAIRAGLAPEELLYSFNRPKFEPLLFAPDAVAGAVAAKLGEGEDQYIRRLAEGQLRVIEMRD
ncbi:hypothetical protein EPN29_13545 [bacterium]|nr:MAG: hypothetical protein EPN29_13545 [bacterium]